MSFITVKKQTKKSEQLKMRDVPKGHLVKTNGGTYAITGNGKTALLLNLSDSDPWFALADGYLDDSVEVIGKIKKINFEIE